MAARARPGTAKLPYPRFPFPPMEAKEIHTLPRGDSWQYEPKWDGFRCIAFKDGNDIALQSKAGQPLGRYFPEVVDLLKRVGARKFVIDGELLVRIKNVPSFDDLLQRIHPADSRVKRLAAETPAIYMVFDLLAEGARVLTGAPLEQRRAALEAFMKKNAREGFEVSPATRKLATAKKWLSGAGGALDGVIAKKTDAAYDSGNRLAIAKIKRRRTADCVVGGFRYATNARVVGSLLLGVYDKSGLLHHVGFASNIPREEKPAVTQRLQTLKGGAGFTGRAPGGPSRWTTDRSSEWIPLEPTLVVEVEYDHFNQRRFRHGTKLLRWRPDKAPHQCTFAQFDR